MVKVKTVEGWGFNCMGYETDECGEFTKKFCKICPTFYSSAHEQERLSTKCKGSGKFLQQSNAYVNVTNIIKKANFAKHLLFENHKKATLRCKDTE